MGNGKNEESEDESSEDVTEDSSEEVSEESEEWDEEEVEDVDDNPTNQPLISPRLPALQLEDHTHMRLSRLQQLMDSDLVYFRENETRDFLKLQELNKALVHHLKSYHKYGMDVLEQEHRKTAEMGRNLQRQNLAAISQRIAKAQQELSKKKSAQSQVRQEQYDKWQKRKDMERKDRLDVQKRMAGVGLEPISPRLQGDDVTKMKNQLGEKDLEIKKLKDEVRALKNVQRIQGRALKTMDVEQQHLPKALHDMAEENSSLKEKLHKLKHQAAKDQKLIIDQHEIISKLKSQLNDCNGDGLERDNRKKERARSVQAPKKMEETKATQHVKRMSESTKGGADKQVKTVVTVLEEDDRPIYIYSPESSMVHSLIHSYKILNKYRVVLPLPLSDSDLEEYHSDRYIQYIKDGDHQQNAITNAEFGLDMDCPTFQGMHRYAQLVAGGSVRCAREVIRLDKMRKREGGEARRPPLAVHWDGGRHHARCDEASGFCYVQDIALCILNLMEEYERVLYVDLDVHHGDGVEEAFYYSDRVLTLSIHKYAPGFFPGTGDQSSTGSGSDVRSHITKVSSSVLKHFDPHAVVVQCGADCLSFDPLGGFNLNIHDVAHCVSVLRSWCLPLIILGGGGYNNSNTARCWANLTAKMVDITLDNDIPTHHFFEKYSPDFLLYDEKDVKQMENKNSREHVEKVTQNALAMIEKLKIE
ncbi:putative histone deacetylase 1-A [Planoprotostelium fungivorum]|uniref:Histone deacetylase 8 n=1 Tax=Planoprotostelium fungivorum TaxID=1890364 RepID=A0A2P6N1V1_9EUKA|nr:putative histone deacetylase 1-A [Planoprotostelium fungivorum]